MARPLEARLLGPWLAPLGAALMFAGALIPYRYLEYPAVQEGHAQKLIDFGASGDPWWIRWWFGIENLLVVTILLLAVLSVVSVILRGPSLWGRGLQLGTGAIGALFMAGVVGATWLPPLSPAAGAFLWMAGGILLLLSWAFLPGDAPTGAPVSSERRGPLLAILAVAVGLFAAAEVVGAINPRNYVAAATLWVVGTVVLLAGVTWAVVSATRTARTNSTAVRRASVAATVIVGAALGSRRTPGSGGDVSRTVLRKGRQAHLPRASPALDWTRVRRCVPGSPHCAGPRRGARSPEVEDVVRRARCPGRRGAGGIHRRDVGSGHPSGRDRGRRRFPGPCRRGAALGRSSTRPAARGSPVEE
jgi:hypothetical protein